MKLGDQRSDNIVDQRRGRGRRAAPTALGLGVVVVIVVVGALMGQDPQAILSAISSAGGGASGGGGSGGGAAAPVDPSAPDTAGDFVSGVLADTEITWREVLPAQLGIAYQEPRLVLFTGEVRSACGFQSAATGPFYCPGDRQVYLDTSFFDELSRRFGAPGDFAQAYVIGHEIGHHIQTLTGASQRVRERERSLPEAQANELSVLLELQADCYAGVWAHHAHADRHVLEEGDLEEGLRAAAAIGDDRLQMQARGYTTPESFTHGTSAQRVQWFRRGFAGGQATECDTFGGAL